jgi:hypothetical protein
MLCGHKFIMDNYKFKNNSKCVNTYFKNGKVTINFYIHNYASSHSTYVNEFLLNNNNITLNESSVASRAED